MSEVAIAHGLFERLRDCGEREDFAVYDDAVAMTFVAIARFVLAIKHDPIELLEAVARLPDERTSG